MSYTILYERCFIKINEEDYIPFVYYANSNVWKADGKGRDKNWSLCFISPRDKLYATKKELVDLLEQDINKIFEENNVSKEVVEKHFGYYIGVGIKGLPAHTSLKKYRSFFFNAFDEIKFEDLEDNNLSLCWILDLRTTTDENKRILNEIAKFLEDKFQVHISPLSLAVYFSNKSQLIKFNLLLKILNKKWNLNKFYVSLGFNATDERVLEVIKKIRKRKRSTKKYIPVTIKQNYYFVLSQPFKYLVKYTRGGYRYCSRPEYAKKFRTKNEAVRYLEKIKEEGYYHAEKWVIQKIEKEAIFKIYKKEV